MVAVNKVREIHNTETDKQAIEKLMIKNKLQQ